MDETGTTSVPGLRTWLKRIGLALLALVLILAAFHRPILHGVGRALAIHFAAKENLKLDCRIEGSVFTNIVIRNLRIVPTGPTSIESVDADYIRADYSLLGYMRNGMAELLKNIELRNVNAVLDPSKAPVVPKPPRPDQPMSVPALFPDRIVISNVNVLVRAASAVQDVVLEDFNLALDPNTPGELRIRKLQLPSIAAWTNIAAQTSYTNRNLVLRGLALGQQDQIRLLGVDASHIDEKKLNLTIDSTIAGGTTTGSIALNQKAKSIDINARFLAQSISLESLGLYLGLKEGALSGTLDRAEIAWSGALDTPRSWDGTISAQLRDVKRDTTQLDRVNLQLTANGAVAHITTAELTQGANTIRLTGEANLPDDTREFGRAPASFVLSGSLPDLHSLGVPVSGAATIDGRVDIRDATLHAALRINGDSIATNAASLDDFTALVTATKKMAPPNAAKVYYADAQSSITIDAKNVRSSDYAIDSLHGVITTADDLVNIEQLVASRGTNNVTLHGTYRLPVDFGKAQLQPADVQLAVNAPELAQFWWNDSPNKLSGPLEMDGSISANNGFADGVINLSSSNLRARNLVVPQLSAQVAIARNVVYLNDLTADLNARDYIRANGIVSTEKPYRYSGNLAVNLADLSSLKPILAAAGNKSELAGSLVADWRGEGTAADFKNSGDLKLRLTNGRFANLNKLEANVDANYSPDELNIPIVYAASDKLMVQAVMQAKGNTLEVTKIQLDQGQAKYAAGYMSVPFTWSNLGTDQPIIPADGKVLINFQSENLDIQKLAKDLGANPPVAGMANLKIDAQGTLQDLHAALDLQLTGLRSQKLSDFTPATFGLTARIENNRLTIDGKLQQARIEPVQITANMPLDVARIAEEKKFDENTPVSAQVKMPRSQVNFVRQFVPALEQIDGTLALDVNVGGTVAKPVLSGAADAHINIARMSNASVPPVSNLNARLAFAGDTLTIQQFSGELSGGNVTVSGAIHLPKLTDPQFDLSLRANQALIARNETLTARADANIRLVGPLTSATVSGDIGITNSQFFKDIDLIPIGTPGRPPPAPQPPSETASFSFPNPPLRDWKFDVAIKTKDPFKIRGNLAHGGALVDMRLTGTGLQPKLDGSVRLQNVEATLPFSRLEIQQGFVYFNPNDPMNPGLDLQGTSTIRDYTVHVYVSGTANTPEATFSSDPPLPQEDIISLLATGVTRQELLSGNNVLAGRALMLLGQQLYRKIFKKGQPTKENPFFENLQLDVGNVDPRTGQQTATARYRVNEKWQVLATIGLQGEFQGQVRYLIRFR
ncbi:MAG TPA: translocation/assembly module TamB domain-containing protein [Chthoniobacterales bacterium]